MSAKKSTDSPLSASGVQASRGTVEGEPPSGSVTGAEQLTSRAMLDSQTTCLNGPRLACATLESSRRASAPVVLEDGLMSAIRSVLTDHFARPRRVFQSSIVDR